MNIHISQLLYKLGLLSDQGFRPSNFYGDYNNPAHLENYNSECSESVGQLYKLIDSDHTMDIEWRYSVGIKNFKVTSDTIEGHMKSLGWKSGDIKNGWKSICINRTPILKYEHLKLKFTKDWNGNSISHKNSTFVINVQH